MPAQGIPHDAIMMRWHTPVLTDSGLDKGASIGWAQFGGTGPIRFRTRNSDGINRVHGCGPIATLAGAISDERIALWEREARTQNGIHFIAGGGRAGWFSFDPNGLVFTAC